MPPLDSAAQQENWEVVDDGEKHDDRMGRGNNDNIESILPLPIQPSPRNQCPWKIAHIC